MTTSIRRFVGCAFIAALLSAPASSLALEPANNQVPWASSRFDTTVYYTTAGGSVWQDHENIASSSDVDYVLFVCPGAGKVGSVGISFLNSNGDLDVEAYDLSGHLLGTSSGVANAESVDVGAFNQHAIVLKVYGYRGATGVYSPNSGCR